MAFVWVNIFNCKSPRIGASYRPPDQSQELEMEMVIEIGIASWKNRKKIREKILISLILFGIPFLIPFLIQMIKVQNL